MADYDDKVIHASMRTAEMTGRVLLALMRAASKKLSNHTEHGKMKLKKLNNTGRKLESLAVDKKDVRRLKKEMARYKLDYSIKFDPVKKAYMVFFKTQDADRVKLAMENCVKVAAKKNEKKTAKETEAPEADLQQDSRESMAVEKQHVGRVKKEFKKEQIEFSVSKTSNKDIRHIAVQAKDFEKASTIVQNCENQPQMSLRERFASRVAQIRNFMDAVREQSNLQTTEKDTQPEIAVTVDTQQTDRSESLDTENLRSVKIDKADIFAIKEQLKSQGVDLSIKQDAAQGVFHVFFKGKSSEEINAALKKCLENAGKKVTLKVKLKEAEKKAEKINQDRQQSMKQEHKQGRQKQRGRQH